MHQLGVLSGWAVTQYGETLARMLTEQDAFAWILKRQSQSVDWAIRYDGYDIIKVEGDRIIYSYKDEQRRRDMERVMRRDPNVEEVATLFEAAVQEAFIRVYGFPEDIWDIERTIQSSYLGKGRRLGWTEANPNVVLVMTERAWMSDPFSSPEEYAKWDQVVEILRSTGWKNASWDSINPAVHVVFWKR